ncbi:MAG: hypothetical protein HQL05_13460 [Nitrospirae bacterium]|uniref:hypothetical protein n=1 Tax=Candidatus Magnetobacterium casense TaxID=1455061 RepID=UPI0005909EAA|nr:hypothetical protein [Candidatus Magnetobacterium casensis]MBF0338822.1 hypothetical protein [Nitrospirota bacterium]
MKNRLRVALLVSLTMTLLLTMAGIVRAEEPVKQHKDDQVRKEEATKEPEVLRPSVTMNMGLLNRYVFRGYEIGTRSISIQPAITVSLEGFSIAYWGNFDTHERATQSFVPDRPGKVSYNETDLTLSYTRSFDKLGLTAGYTYYAMQYAKQTQEVFVSATYGVFSNPTISIYRDIDAYPGTYFNLKFSQSFPVYKYKGNDITLDAGACFGYMAGSSGYWKTLDSFGRYNGSKYNALHDGMLSAGITIPLAKGLQIQPLVQFWYPLSSKAHRTINGVAYNPNGNIDSTVVYGLNLTYSF